MSRGFSNPVVGGSGILKRPVIRSPNYVPGVSGWTINEDGTVEFNSGTFRGTITAGTFAGTNFVINTNGAFFYSSTPALGNLIVSIASSAGTDSFGNAYPQGINVTKGTITGTTIQALVYIATNLAGQFLGYTGAPATGNLLISIAGASGTDGHSNAFDEGVEIHSGSSKMQVHVNAGASAPAIEMFTGAVSEHDHSAIYSHPFNIGLVNEGLNTFLGGPSSTFDSKSANVVLQTALKDGSGNGFGELEYANKSILTWDDVNYIKLFSPSNSAWAPIGIQKDTGTFTVTGTGVTILSNVWGIFSADIVKVGTTFTARFVGRGVQMSTSAQDIVLQCSGINGTGGPWCNIQLHISQIFAAGATFNWDAEMSVVIKSLGVSGTCDLNFSGKTSLASGTLISNTANGPNYMCFSRQQQAVAIDTTADTNITLQGFWTVVSGSGSLTCNSSEFQYKRAL